MREGRSERESNYSDTLTNDIELAFTKQPLPSVTDCNEGRSIPSLHSISYHDATQITPQRESRHILLHFPHTMTAEGGDLTVNSQSISLLFSISEE